MEPFRPFRSLVIVLPDNDIDTDQIIPARYLKVTGKTGLAEGLFSGWRYLPDSGSAQPNGDLNPDFPLNQPELRQARILLAGNNFGCGSSREHAPWALVSWGFRAVISTSFADIFRSNALKNGLLPVAVDPADHRRLLALFQADPFAYLEIDLAGQFVKLPDGGSAQQIGFPIDPFSKTCLLQGIDTLGYLVKHSDRIAAYEARTSSG